MSRIKCDITGLQNLEKSLKNMQKTAAREALLKETLEAYAREFVKSVSQKTPVGQYPKVSHKVGGTLKHAWEGDASVVFITSGGRHEVVIRNGVPYASFVEFGHRSGSGFTRGRFMMTSTEQEMDVRLAQFLDSKMQKYWEESLYDTNSH